jgi:hypothetical protein
MSNRTNITSASKNVLFVPLCELKKSPKNVRKVPHTKADIQAFAPSKSTDHRNTSWSV